MAKSISINQANQMNWRSWWAYYSKFLLRWGWFVILTIIVTTTITRFLPDAPSTTTYEASLQVQISLPSGSGVVAMSNASTFFSNLLASPGTLSLAVPKLNKLPQFQDLQLDSLQSLVSASAVAGVNVVQLNAIGATPQDATTIANAVYSAFLETLHLQRSTVVDKLRTILNAELKQVDTDLANTATQLEQLSATGQTATHEYHFLSVQHLEEQHLADTLNKQLLALNQQGFVGGDQDIIQLVKPAPNITTIPPTAPTQDVRLVLAPIVGLLMGLAGALLANRFSVSLPLRGKKRELVLPNIATTFPVLPEQQGKYLSLLQQAAPECYPLLRHLRYQASEHEKRLQLLTVTSPRRRAGKSTLAASIAIAAAQSGLRTLLIDAQLDRPVLHTWFQVSNTVGLADSIRSLSEGAPGPSPIVSTSIPELGLLPIGQLHPGKTGATLEESLRVDGLRRLTELLTSQVDLILFDGPSLLTDTGAINLVSLSDLTLLVIDAKGSKSTEVLEAESLLADLGAPYATILNQASRELVD